MTTPVKVALVGAGIFMRDAHLPSLLALGEQIEIIGVYSRTAQSANQVVALLHEQSHHSPRIYTELDALLAEPEIEAVDVVLPIPLLADAVGRSLAAGKHVISEKPICATVQEARDLLKVYDDVYRGRLVWMVGENWRFEAAVLKAAEIVRSGQIGKPLSFGWNIHVAISPDNKYYGTAWRRDNSFPDGFLRDGGVHHIAALRMILGEVRSVTAHVAAHRADLPPLDTLAATLHMANGAVGTYSVTYAAGVGHEDALLIAGEHGLLRAGRRSLEVRTTDGKTSSESFGLMGVQTELASFAQLVRQQPIPHDLEAGDPRQALQDLVVLQAMIDSAHKGQRVEISG